MPDGGKYLRAANVFVQRETAVDDQEFVCAVAVYVAGDSGYSPYYKEIGTRLGPFRLSMIPIGTYRPAWYFKPMHQDPAEAVQAHRDVGSAFSVGMHWGTFKLSDEPLAEPPLFLRKALKEKKIAEGSFITLRFGETAVY